MIDLTVQLGSFPNNVTGMPFDNAEAGYLAGYLGASEAGNPPIISAVAGDRLLNAEIALDETGKAGVKRLFELKRDPITSTSSLLGRGGLHPLSAASKVADQQLPMPQRRVLIDQARRLRDVSPFESLTQHEATTLRAMMEEVAVPAGEAIIRRGDIGDSLYVIEQGTAVVQASEEAGTARVIARLGPGHVVARSRL